MDEKRLFFAGKQTGRMLINTEKVYQTHG